MGEHKCSVVENHAIIPILLAGMVLGTAANLTAEVMSTYYERKHEGRGNFDLKILIAWIVMLTIVFLYMYSHI